MKLTEKFIRTLPKVVLHDHLDGGLRTQTIIELAKEIGKSSREIVTLLNEMGIPVLSHANTVDDEAIAKVKEKIAITVNNEIIIFCAITITPLCY